MAKVEALKNHLEALRNAIPELKGVLLASSEGLPIAHSLTNGADPNRELGEVSVQAQEGALFVYSAGAKAVLVVLSPNGGNAGLIHLEARDTAKQIAELF
jgi:predicted regulator of Ras-like GTPase activity (Roadblock/LC7/MglB family)